MVVCSTPLAEDVTAFAAADASGVRIAFERLAVTEQQIVAYRLPTARRVLAPSGWKPSVDCWVPV